VASLDEPHPNRSFRIRVSFQPAVRAFSRTARPATAVRQTPDLPPQQIGLGDVEARCDKHDCSVADLTHALRLTAARLGADSFAAARCVERDAERACVATLGADPYDPVDVAAAR
jgi:hypothetical protein